jgi:hypothetical protein
MVTSLILGIYQPSSESLDAPRALPGLSCRFIYLDRVGGAGEHQERATGGTRELLGGASVDHASDRAVAARAYDQQIERCAVQR